MSSPSSPLSTASTTSLASTASTTSNSPPSYLSSITNYVQALSAPIFEPASRLLLPTIPYSQHHQYRGPPTNGETTVYRPEPIPADETIHIVIVLDKSGSMENNRVPMKDAINSFIKDQQQQSATSNLEGVKQQTVKVTLTQFDNKVTPTFVCRPLSECTPLTLEDYILDGSTALYDALGVSIHQFSKCDGVIMVVVTDGQDNSSREYTKSIIAQLIKDKREKQYWDLHYLCADESGFVAGQALGMTSNFQSPQCMMAQAFTTSLSNSVQMSRASPQRQAQSERYSTSNGI